MDDQQAIERYRYMLRTAPPDDIERAHADAFARLTPDQRRQVLDGLAGQVPTGDVPQSDDPQSLARMATRAEMRQPGTIERTFGRAGPGYGGPGLGGMFFATLAGAFIGTAIADSFFNDNPGAADAAAAGDQSGSDQMSDSGSSGEFGDSSDAGGAGDVGDGGFGEMGGGDLGDFGGGDIGF
jgi:hypothetical protein